MHPGEYPGQGMGLEQDGVGMAREFRPGMVVLFNLTEDGE